MAKLPTKKKEKTPEEQAAELAAMMGDVSPIRLTPGATQPTSSAPSPQPSTPPAKAVVSVTPPAAPANAAPIPEATEEAPAVEPTASDKGGEGDNKNSASAPPVAPSAGATPEVEEQDEEIVDDEAAEQTPQEPAPQPVSAAAVNFDVKSLFVPTKDKKTVMFRITPAMHQYFQQIGMILGNGTSVPDVVHNILTQWKADHGAQVQKAMQKQLRQMLKN